MCDAHCATNITFYCVIYQFNWRVSFDVTIKYEQFAGLFNVLNSCALRDQ